MATRTAETSSYAIRKQIDEKNVNRSNLPVYDIRVKFPNR